MCRHNAGDMAGLVFLQHPNNSYSVQVSIGSLVCPEECNSLHWLVWTDHPIGFLDAGRVFSPYPEEDWVRTVGGDEYPAGLWVDVVECSTTHLLVHAQDGL